MLPSTRTGRDGRQLVPTELAAYSLGLKAASFRSWAARRGVTPVAHYRPPGKRGQATAMWDLADLTDAMREQETNTA
ncbi:hypothetical protein [Streptomyces sp. NBC_00996]|uniref:hypothetical protein n=1 Tax=Streptomyces sp. NBC_00996 TaxID=2903710 RepID=UPI0038707CC9|nr:hypothetical protein OG390_25030 [Streptomyces sp. NBC_00996]